MDWDVRFTARCGPLLLAVLAAGCDADAATARVDAGSGSTDAEASTSTATPSGAATDGGADVESTTGRSPSSTSDDEAPGEGTATRDTIDEGSTITGDATTTGVPATRGTSDTSGGNSMETSPAGSMGGASSGDTTTSGSTDDTTTGEPSTGAEPPTGGESSTGGDDDPCTYSEDFEGYADGSPWPAGWGAVGGVGLADIEGGWGRLRPVLTDYSLARMVRALPCAEPDISLTFMFTAVEAQGVGLYTRHNGGYLMDTVPPGRGYSAFAEAFRNPHGIGVWREVGGTEQQLAHQPATIEVDVEYRMRYRVTQLDPGTSLLQAKIWPVGEPEPVDWMVESTDSAFNLQSTAGRMAIDAWVSEDFNGPVAPDLLIDDIVVSPAL